MKTKTILFALVGVFLLTVGFTPTEKEPVGNDTEAVIMVSSDVDAVTMINFVSVEEANEVLTVYAAKDGLKFISEYDELVVNTVFKVNEYSLADGSTLKYMVKIEELPEANIETSETSTALHRRCTECKNCIQTCYYNNGMVVDMECGGRDCEDNPKQ